MPRHEFALRVQDFGGPPPGDRPYVMPFDVGFDRIQRAYVTAGPHVDLEIARDGSSVLFEAGALPTSDVELTVETGYRIPIPLSNPRPVGPDEKVQFLAYAQHQERRKSIHLLAADLRPHYAYFSAIKSLTNDAILTGDPTIKAAARTARTLSFGVVSNGLKPRIGNRARGRNPPTSTDLENSAELANLAALLENAATDAYQIPVDDPAFRVHLMEGYASFTDGSLRVTSAPDRPYLNAEPDSAYYLMFAEFAAAARARFEMEQDRPRAAFFESMLRAAIAATPFFLGCYPQVNPGSPIIDWAIAPYVAARRPSAQVRSKHLEIFSSLSLARIIELQTAYCIAAFPGVASG
jgi:hypothetical protein